jgi:hypothetical protein
MTSPQKALFDQPIGVRAWKPTGNTAAPAQQEAFRELDADLFLAHQLFRAGRSGLILQGITVSAERRERIRGEIISCNYATRFLTSSRGRPLEETFAQAFARLYGEALETRAIP